MIDNPLYHYKAILLLYTNKVFFDLTKLNLQLETDKRKKVRESSFMSTNWLFYTLRDILFVSRNRHYTHCCFCDGFKEKPLRGYSNEKRITTVWVK